MFCSDAGAMPGDTYVAMASLFVVGQQKLRTPNLFPSNSIKHGFDASSRVLP
jgi:hypothetical protein